MKKSADGMLNLSIGLTEEGFLAEAYQTLIEGYSMKLKEEPNIDPYNDFQLHFIYLLHQFVEYDSSKEAKELKETHKVSLKNVKDDETKLILTNNKLAEDRLLFASAAYKQMAEIKLAKSSTHEVTIRLNKVMLLLKQKNTEEAKKEMQELEKLCGGEINIKDERYFLLNAYILQMYISCFLFTMNK
jgi:hypothetical protein